MTESLAGSASPYLRAHADNPVAWFPWGEAAFAEARRRDVPVLVSIGYATCHWCHVMARESFADAVTAAEINAHFVAIKVDREEHPEVDAAYLAAAVAFTPHLGWPLTVFTTPDGGPFFAGTYFPPESRSGLPAFRQVLAAVTEAWEKRRGQVDETATAIRSALADVGHSQQTADSPPGVGELAAAARVLAGREDREFGGFGNGDDAPKFPVATALRFLQAMSPEEPGAAAVADRALAAMAASELFDDVDGGFFRYATRRDWSVPHFERMLTDNALLLEVASAAHDEATVRALAGFLLDVLQQPSGGFAAAQDSESWIDGARSEGGYYARDAAGREGLDAPALDGKIVTGWNGLAIAALARAGARYDEPRWIEAARWAADAVVEANTDGSGHLVRASLDEIPSRAAATLADYGQFATGLVALAIATGDVAYAVRARTLVEMCRDSDGFLRVPGGGDPVLASQAFLAPQTASDADEPSGPASIAEASLALWMIGAGDDHRRAAEWIVLASAPSALAQPLAHGTLLRVAAGLARPPRQVVVVLPDDTSATADADARTTSAELVTAARGIPAEVVAIVRDTQARWFAEAGFDLFVEKAPRGARATAFDCRAFACRLPVTVSAELISE